MQTITKRINGQLIKCRPQPALTNHAPLDLPFVNELIMFTKRAKNTNIHVFTLTNCVNTVYIGESTPHVGLWNWYSALIVNANPILQSSL